MNAKIEASGGCKILRVSGRIDFESALDFEHHINAMIQEGGDCFIIELSQVELLSSAGLRVMLSTAKRVPHHNASLALAAPSQVVRQVFEISHFNLLFKIFPSVPGAITALKGGVEISLPDDFPTDSLPAPDSAGPGESKTLGSVVSAVGFPAKPPAPGEVLPPVVSPKTGKPEPPDVHHPSETPTVAPPPFPTGIAEPLKGKATTALPKRSQAQSARQTPPPLPVIPPVPIS